MTIVSVLNEPPGLRSEPINRKLTVSCPLLRTWLPDASMVGNGATVLMRKFGSAEGTPVWVGAGGVEVWVAESAIGWERGEAVCVQGMGWKGVGVGEAFGAAVTSTKGREAGAGAAVPHPASNSAATIIQLKHFMVMCFVSVIMWLLPQWWRLAWELMSR